MTYLNISLHPPLGFVRQKAKSHWPVCIKWHPGSRYPPLDHHTFFPERALEQHKVGSRRTCRVYCPRRTRYWSQSQLFWCWNQHLTASFLPTHTHTKDRSIYLAGVSGVIPSFSKLLSSTLCNHLQVSVNNVLLMTVVHCRNNLRKKDEQTTQ